MNICRSQTLSVVCFCANYHWARSHPFILLLSLDLLESSNISIRQDQWDCEGALNVSTSRAKSFSRDFYCLPIGLCALPLPTSMAQKSFITFFWYDVRGKHHINRRAIFKVNTDYQTALSFKLQSVKIFIYVIHAINAVSVQFHHLLWKT